MVHLFLQESAVEELDNHAPAEAAVALRTKKGMIRPRGLNQLRYVKEILGNDINFGIGPAGTGKTYLAVACAVDALEREQIRRILLVRPAVEAGEKLGFLPGDLAQKIDPYLRPLYDALYEMLGFEYVAKLIEKSGDRSRAAGLHARSYPEQQLHHSRRKSEHHRRADEDVPDPYRLRLHRGDHR